MLVQPQQAATVCEFDPVQHVIGSLERAQTLDPNPRPESSHEPLNLTLDLEYAHVSRHLGSQARHEVTNEPCMFTVLNVVRISRRLRYDKAVPLEIIIWEELHGPRLQ